MNGFVLDASFFFSDRPIEGTFCTTPSIELEIKDLAARCRFDRFCDQGLFIEDPPEESIEAVRKNALHSGDLPVLSEPDISIIALAHARGFILVSDDFAVQNCAQTMGIEVRPIAQKKARVRKWKYRCSGCGRYVKGPGICDVCGSEIKRKIK